MLGGAEDEDDELFPAALVQVLGELQTLTLGTMEEYWTLVGEVERESTVVFEFIAWNSREPVGKTEGKNSYDMEWTPLIDKTTGNERFPAFLLSYPKNIYDEYAHCTPRIRLFMTLIVCEDRWKAGYCAVKGRLKWF